MLALFAVPAIFLTGCGVPVAVQAGTPHDASVAPPPTVTATNTTQKITSSLSPRGLIPKTAGQVASIGDATNPDLSFTVDAITVDDKCTSQFAEKPENGHFVVLSMTVKTSVTMDKTLFFMITASDFSVVGADGVTDTNLSTAGAFECLSDREQFPRQQLAAGSQYVGKVVLDSKNTHGILEYRPPMLANNSGWEWTF
jgi:hypothetical protein